MAAASAFPAPLVDEAAQRFKYAGEPVNLVENHKPALVLFQVEFWLSQLGAVGGQLQIEVKCLFAQLLCQSPGKRGLANLPRAKDGDGRKLAKKTSLSTEFGVLQSH